MLVGATSFANMKKGRVASKGDKTFGFSTSADGPCTVSVIYDSVSADLDTAIGAADTGDLLCLGVSTQLNFDSCTAGLPPGDYAFVVSSFQGSSAFRAVVNCGSEEQISAAGQKTTGITINEIEGTSNTRKLLDRLHKVAVRKQ